MTRTSALYHGAVVHARTDELIHRAFRYPVYIASIDLAELPALDRELRLFSHGGTNLFALHDRDYEAGGLGLPAALADLLAGNGLPVPHATRLVTNLRVLGYVFNPVSFFLNYDAGDALTSVIAEVNNTYGGRRRYVLGPDQRIAHPGRVGFRHVRELFVSPFLHGPATYDFWFDAPLDGDRLAITMHVTRPAPPGEPSHPRSDADRNRSVQLGSGERIGDRIFVAHLAGTRRPLTDRALLGAAVRYPLMTAQVIGLIHLEAARLRLRGIPYVRPGRDHRPRPIPPSVRSPTSTSGVPAAATARRLK